MPAQRASRWAATRTVWRSYSYTAPLPSSSSKSIPVIADVPVVLGVPAEVVAAMCTTLAAAVVETIATEAMEAVAELLTNPVLKMAAPTIVVSLSFQRPPPARSATTAPPTTPGHRPPALLVVVLVMIKSAFR